MSWRNATGPTFSDLISRKQASLSPCDSSAVGRGPGLKSSGGSGLGTDPWLPPCHETADIAAMLHQNDQAHQRCNEGDVARSPSVDSDWGGKRRDNRGERGN